MSDEEEAAPPAVEAAPEAAPEATPANETEAAPPAVEAAPEAAPEATPANETEAAPPAVEAAPEAASEATPAIETEAAPPAVEAAPEAAPEPPAEKKEQKAPPPPAPVENKKPSPATKPKAKAKADSAPVEDKSKRESGGPDSIDHMQVHPPSPSKVSMKPHEPWLKGTFRTPKGRLIKGEDLCQSLDRMYNAPFARKLDGPTGSERPAPGAMPTKILSQSEYEDMVSRLYQTKAISEGDEGKLEAVMLKYDEEGKEQWVPTKKVSYDEQKEYLCELYNRCIESKKKTHDELAAKYLKPLGIPRKA